MFIEICLVIIIAYLYTISFNLREIYKKIK